VKTIFVWDRPTKPRIGKKRMNKNRVERDFKE
jgi:hypothetical protein